MKCEDIIDKIYIKIINDVNENPNNPYYKKMSSWDYKQGITDFYRSIKNES